MSPAFNRQQRLGCIWFSIIGLCAGWLAGKLTQGHGFGAIDNFIIGVIGAVLGGFLFTLLGLETKSKLGSLVMATVGALVLLAIARAVRR
jgi:uncharacterized membrane protein YeaQ/YmgE (transglycosylase-associated protein family)